MPATLTNASIRFEKRTLSNGLTVVAEIIPTAASAACGFYVRTGARDEEPRVMGVSHFLEHMMFKGTDTMSAEDLNRAFDDLGATNNAYTSAEITCFYAHVLPERLLQTIDLLGRMMRPALRVADFDTEKGVILEEIAMYKDNPFWVLYEASLEKHYGAHGMGHRVLGTDQTITALARDQMKAYFDARYSADNTIVALAGNVDLDAAIAQLESTCGAWQSTRPSRIRPAPTPVGGELRLTDAKVARGYLLALAQGPAIQDERKYAASLLGQVLGAADNSRLHWSLVETGIAAEAVAAFDAHDGCGDYYFFASADPDRLDEVWDTIRKEIAALGDSLTEEDLVRLRNKALTGATVGGERPADRMHRLGRLYTYLGQYQPLEEELDKLNRVTLDDLRAVLRDFPLEPRTVGRLTPA